MTTPRRPPSLKDVPSFFFVSMMWGLVGGAVGGVLVGLVLAAREMAIGGAGHPESYLVVMPILGGYAGVVLGTPVGLAYGVVLAMYVMIRRTALRHEPADIARTFPAIVLLVVGAAAIWAYFWVHSSRGPNLEFDLWLMLPTTIAAAIVGWCAARRMARSYLRANNYQNDAIAEVLPRRRRNQRQVTSAEPSTTDD